MLRVRRSQSTAATGVASAEPPVHKKGQMAILRTMPSDTVRDIASVKANIQPARLIKSTSVCFVTSAEPNREQTEDKSLA